MGKRNGLLLVGCLVSAFIGGAVSNWALLPQVADAQTQTQVATEVGARSFVVADENDKVCAVLGVDKDGPWVMLNDERVKLRAWRNAGKEGKWLGLNDENGKSRAWFGVDKFESGLILLDEKEKTIWKAP